MKIINYKNSKIFKTAIAFVLAQMIILVQICFAFDGKDSKIIELERLSSRINIGFESVQFVFDHFAADMHAADSLKSYQKVVKKDVLFEQITYSLVEAGVDMEYVATILLELSQISEIENKTAQLIDNAKSIASFLNAMESFHVKRFYINVMLEAIIHIDNLNEQIGILDGISLRVAEFINILGVEEIFDFRIAFMLRRLIVRGDVEDRIDVFLLLLKELKITGKSSWEIISIFERTCSLDNISQIAQQILRKTNSLENTTKVRGLETGNIAKLKEAGQFNRSIVSICPDQEEEFAGSAFVVYETDEYSILLTNRHVVGNRKSVNIATNEKEPALMARAEVVIRNKSEQQLLDDIAVLAVRKSDIRGVNLVPISITNYAGDKDLATLISGYNDTISTGHMVLAGAFAFLIGARSIAGDSGAPVLVKNENGEFVAAAVHVAAGSTSIVLNRELIDRLYKAFEQTDQVDGFEIVSEEGKEAVEEFLAVHKYRLILKVALESMIYRNFIDANKKKSRFLLHHIARQSKHEPEIVPTCLKQRNVSFIEQAI